LQKELKAIVCRYSQGSHPSGDSVTPLFRI
jgi:hypothetical protein